jgi:formamidopyrimidine-DNA glycosylase
MASLATTCASADNPARPELPEVEVTRRSFASRIEGAQVRDVRLGAPLRWPLGIEPGRLVGLSVGAVSRRGKYLWLPLTGHEHGGLLMHLGMSGSLAFRDTAAAPGKHDHFDLATTRGMLRLTDPRRFGAVLWSPALDADPAAKLLRGLGHEPFDPALDGATLHAALQRRRTSVKAALLAGDIVVGAGNIYACEALFDAGIDPRTRCDRISRPRAERLLAAVRLVLGRALELGGSTLRDFRDAHGMSGGFQLQAKVYGRAGEPCTCCGAALRRIVQGQRATYFCSSCQRR